MNGLEEKVTWKPKKSESERKGHFWPLYLSNQKRYVKQLFRDVIPMYQSVIAENNGFAPRILQKLWVSENCSIYYLNSWVKTWAIPPIPLTSFFSKTVWNCVWINFFHAIFFNIKAGRHEESFVKIWDDDLPAYEPLQLVWPTSNNALELDFFNLQS